MSSNDERPAVFGLQPNRAPDPEQQEPCPASKLEAGVPESDAAPDADVIVDDDNTEADAGPRLQTPTDYLVELCGLHQIVLLGDQTGVAQHVKTVADSVGALAAAGIDNLAWEFTNSRAQPQLDALLTAPRWDDRACAELFVDLLGIGFAYDEYAAVLKAAWDVNQHRGTGSTPFRVIALGVPTYVEDPSLLEGRSAGELELRNWWMGGHYRDLSAFHMANVLTAEVIRHGQRALVYCSVERTTTRLIEWHDGLAPVTLGNLLHRWMGEGVQRVVFHGAIDDPGAIERVEALIEAAPEDVEQLGIDLELSTLGNVGLADVVGTIAGDQHHHRLGDVADGYLYVAPRAQWRPCELIADLITPANFVDVEARYRALDPRDERYTHDELEAVRIEGQALLEAGWPSLPEPEEPEQKKRRFRRR